jgi:probable HAF family extracellular repeat protein
MKLKSSALALILAVAGCMTSAVAQVTYSYESVQYSQNGVTDQFTQLLGINNAGLIAGYHGANVNKGFRYDAATKTFFNENFPGSAQTQVIGINNLGKTVGFYVTTTGLTKGFQFQNGVYTNTNFPGEPFNQLLGQNDLAQAAGYYSGAADGSAPDHAYIYDENGQVFELFVIPGSVQAQATGINNEGQVCGFTIDSKGVNHGWLSITGNLTILNFPESTGTQALGLNNKGQVVGSYTDAAGNSHGFVYEVTTKKWQSIDDPDGVGTTLVNGINDDGVLVGFFGTSPINTGFIATPQP